MKNTRVATASLMVALALGTAWAVRGKFGHEHGAAWAGAIGAITLILVAKREDWYHRLFEISLAAAFGWGLSGMISYGMVVGYARADEFINVYYGLLMLFVIGGLYGFLGGGIFSLAISDTREEKVPWAVLITEMVAFGVLTYGLVINQLEWLMTPPRSELWAACLGACIPVAWYAVRTNKKNVLRVALWSALGAGFGFSFGNFLQVMAITVHFPMNPWNVMEYSIGFFGGLGMAYGTFTSTWPVLEAKSGMSRIVSALWLLVIIPFVLWDQSFSAEQLKHVIELGGTSSTVTLFQWLAIISITMLAVIVFSGYMSRTLRYTDVRNILLLYAGIYTFLSFLQTGIWVHPFEQYLYLVNIALVVFIAARLQPEFGQRVEDRGLWAGAAMLAVAVVLIMTVVVLTFNTRVVESAGRF